METRSGANPEIETGPRQGGVYTPIDPLTDYDDLAEDTLVVDPMLDEDDEDSAGNPSEKPEQPAYDGDVSEQTPGHHKADRDFEYDDEDLDDITR